MAILAPWLLQDPNDSSYFGSVDIIAKATADALGVPLKYTDATWDTVIAGLVAHKYQIAAAPILETEKRKKVAGFVTFGKAGSCFVVRPDSPIKTLDDLNNPDITYLGYTGLANDDMFHEKYPDTKVQMISPPPGHGPRIPEVLSGRGDIAAIEAPLAYWVQSLWPEARIIPAVDECVTNPDLVRSIGIGYPKGDEAFAIFLASVIAAHQGEIDDSIKKFSQTEWLDKK
jgi:ABC-type amino acid transport substrate-binding protein